MSKLYSVGDVAKMTGVCGQTVRTWESQGYIPEATRIGLKRTRYWGEWAVLVILQWAEANDYHIRKDGMRLLLVGLGEQ